MTAKLGTTLLHLACGAFLPLRKATPILVECLLGPNPSCQTPSLIVF